MSEITIASPPPVATPATDSETQLLRGFGLFLGGLALLGTCLALGRGAPLVGRMAVGMPALFISVVVLTTPALYIGAGLLGVAPPTKDAAAALATAFTRSGRLVLGLAPASAFLTATLTGTPARLGVIAIMVIMTAMFAVRALYSSLVAARGESAPTRLQWLFAGWSFVSAGIGLFWVDRFLAL